MNKAINLQKNDDESNSQSECSIFKQILQDDPSIRELYGTIDTNHDNILDRAEVLSAFKVLGYAI